MAATFQKSVRIQDGLRFYGAKAESSCGPERARGNINLTVGGFAVGTRQLGAPVIYLTGSQVSVGWGMKKG